MKRHLGLVVGLAIIIINVFITTRFIMLVRHIMALQTRNSLQLPMVPSRKEPVVQTSTLTLTIGFGGSVYAEGEIVKGESLASLLRARAPKKVIVKALKGAQYSEVKAFLGQLKSFGVKDIVFTVSDSH